MCQAPFFVSGVIALNNINPSSLFLWGRDGRRIKIVIKSFLIKVRVESIKEEKWRHERLEEGVKLS